MNIDWFVVIAQIFNFLVFVFLLKRFLYKPIVQSMDLREAKIENRLAEAAAKVEDAGRLAESYQQQIRELAGKREQLLAEARAEADALRKDLLQKVREEVAESQAKWHETLRQQRDLFLRGLRQRAGKQVCIIAGRALSDLAGADLNRAIMDNFLHRIRSMNQETREQLTGAIRNAEGEVLLRSAFELEQEEKQQAVVSLRENLLERIEVRFETSPDLICGVELKAHDYQMSWNLEHYLQSLEEDFIKALEEEAQAKTGTEKMTG